MSKRNKIIYWITTGWLALGMLSTGIVQLMQRKQEMDMMRHLDYPIYFLTIIGVWKILGVIALIIPKAPITQRMDLCRFFLCHVRRSPFAFSHWR